MTRIRRAQLDAAQSGVKVWSSPAWQDTAVAWLDERLAAAGVTRRGAIDCAHVRPWAAVFRVPTTAGPVWLKAAGPPAAFEAGLYPLLHQVAPEYVLNPIAADVERGWLVLPDGGVPLADHVPEPDLIESMVTLLPHYGQLQRDLVPHVAGLRALGVPNMSPAVMPRRFAKAISVVGRFAASEGDEADRAMVQRVAGLGETFAAWCGDLATSPVAPSLDHNDLHPGNILVTGTGDTGQARFFDWGDSVVAHPFTSLLIPLRYLRHELGVSDDDPALRRVRDAYLDAFSDLAPHAELVTTLETACQVGKVMRTLVWASTALGTNGQRRSLRRRATQWLGFLLDDSYLGSV